MVGIPPKVVANLLLNRSYYYFNSNRRPVTLVVDYLQIIGTKVQRLSHDSPVISVVRVSAFIYLSILIASLYGLAVVVKQGEDTKAPAVSVQTTRASPHRTGLRSEQRPVYPFSIVPGGVVSRDELKAAMRTDRLVAAHYAAVDVDRLKPVTLKHDLAAYVSFRMHGQVYWTSRRVLLAKGERVLQGGTDGAIGVRERCGNQISEQPRVPVLPDMKTEPSGAMLATPIQSPPAQASRTEAAGAPYKGALAQGATAEDGFTDVPVSGGGPVGYQGGGDGGGVIAGGGGAGGGGAGGGGGGTAGQPVSTAPASYVAPGVSPEVNTLMPVDLLVLPAITTGSPPASPVGWTSVWFSPLPTPVPTLVTPAPFWISPSAPPVPVPVYSGVPMVTPRTDQTPPTPPILPTVRERSTVLPPNLPPMTMPGTPLPVTPPGEALTPPVAAVPEPSTWLMLGVGLGLLILRSGRRRVLPLPIATEPPRLFGTPSNGN